MRFPPRCLLLLLCRSFFFFNQITVQVCTTVHWSLHSCSNCEKIFFACNVSTGVFVCMVKPNKPWSLFLSAHLGCRSDRMAIRVSHRTSLPFYFASYLLARLVWQAAALWIPIKMSGKGDTTQIALPFHKTPEIHPQSMTMLQYLMSLNDPSVKKL